MKPIQSEVDKCLDLVKELFDKGLYDALFYRAMPNLYDGIKPSWECGIHHWINDNYKNYKGKNIYFYTGLTKLCIVMEDNKDWVIKLPIIRNHAPIFSDSRDFCACETANYNDALDEGLEHCFAAEFKVGEIKEIGIYMQEYVEMNEDAISNSCFDYAKSQYDEKDFKSHDDYIDAVYDIAEDLDDDEKISALLPEEYDKLSVFIENHHINDLHNGNWGYNKEGKIVLVDYSGYVI